MVAEAQDAILPLVKLRAVLSLCEAEPIGCAFGLTKDKKECLLLVDKRSKPKTVASLLKSGGKEHLDPKTLRFGRVEVDTVNDPGTLRFTINRSEAGGTIMTLNKLAKRAGYQAIVINADESLEKEPEESAIPAAPPPPPQATPADPAALKLRLTELVKRMAERLPKDPANQEQLGKLAKAANIQLGTNNFKTATELMNGLEKILDTPLPVAPGSPAADMSKIRQARETMDAALQQAAGLSSGIATAIKDHDASLAAAIAAGDQAAARDSLMELSALSKRTAPSNDGAAKGLVEFAKLRLDWDSAKKAVSAKLAELGREIDDDDTDEESSDLFGAAAKKLDLVLARFNEGLGDTVDKLSQSTDTDQRKKLAASAQATADKYLSYITSSKLVEHIDDNPYEVAVNTRGTLLAPLQALKARLVAIG